MEADAPSFEKIDYSLRPAKSTERWMLLEALSRLAIFTPVAEYRYVGLGSPFFVDFRLFHRRLGITDMLSIERETDYEERFKFNVPFECVELEWGKTTDVLPMLDWSVPTIAWLDYDYQLEQSILTDLTQVVDRAKHGDCLLVTVDAEPPVNEAEIEKLENGLGSWGSPFGTPESLAGWVLAERFYELLHSRAVRATKDRGAGLEWVQLFRFHYKDSSRMLTYGGVFVDRARKVEFGAAGFENLSFVVKEDDSPFTILMPMLTLKETGAVDEYMPGNVETAIAKLGELAVEKDHVERYARIYRYASTFHESQV